MHFTKRALSSNDQTNITWVNPNMRNMFLLKLESFSNQEKNKKPKWTKIAIALVRRLHVQAHYSCEDEQFYEVQREKNILFRERKFGGRTKEHEDRTRNLILLDKYIRIYVNIGTCCLILYKPRDILYEIQMHSLLQIFQGKNIFCFELR